MKTVFAYFFKVSAAAMMLAALQVYAEVLKPTEVVPVIDGEVFPKIARVEGEEGVFAFQYVRESEGFTNWTKTVVYSNYQLEHIGDETQRVAARLVEGLQQLNPGAKYQLLGDDEGKVLILDFLSWPPSQQYMEFSAYRIQKGEPGEGVFTLQFSVRLPFLRDVTEEVKTKLKNLRASELQQLMKYDMNKVIQLLREQRAAQEQSE